MPKVMISWETKELLEKACADKFKVEATDYVTVEVSPEIDRLIARHRMTGESDDGVIKRLLAMSGQDKPILR